MDGRAPFGMGGLGGRRQGPRSAGLPDKAVDESRGLPQNYGYIHNNHFICCNVIICVTLGGRSLTTTVNMRLLLSRKES